VAPPLDKAATVTATLRLLLALRLACAGVTVTEAWLVADDAGQAFTTLATLSDPRPVAWS
jgi:hypothetical protein